MDRIVFTCIAQLDVFAASGLVIHGDELVVIADDELSLSRYTREGSPRGALRLFPGELPDKPKKRKKAKPDLEAIVTLGEQLLALGSGSKPTRDRGALVRGDRVIEVSLTPLYDVLRERFDRLNVEGGCVVGPHLVLLTRRTGRRGRNTLVRLSLPGVLAALDESDPTLDGSLVHDIVDIELGAIAGTPYGFTDAASWRGGILFSAAAEVTDDPVDDGATVGCMIGWIDPDARVHATWPVEPCLKIEGIAVTDDDNLLAVADADDRTIAAPLLSAPLPRLP